MVYFERNTEFYFSGIFNLRLKNYHLFNFTDTFLLQVIGTY